VQVMLMNRDGIGSIYVYYSTFVLFMLVVFDQASFELGDIPLELPPFGETLVTGLQRTLFAMTLR
jgi:hypothetical protein